MGTRITLINERGKKREFFYRTVSKEIVHAPEGSKVTSCRLDVDIENTKDVLTVQKFLRHLELSMWDINAQLKNQK